MEASSAGTATQAPAEFIQRVTPWVVTITSMVAFAAAAVLMVEKIILLGDPTYVPTCSINPVLSCGSIMKSDQAEAFGFPNPLLGLAGFGLMATFGAATLVGVRAPRFTWLLAQAGAVFAFGFVCWLIFQSLYRIEALCPYCMVVWLATFTLAWYLTLANFSSGRIKVPAPLRPVLAFATKYHAVLLTGAVLIVVALITEAFWDYWSTLP